MAFAGHVTIFDTGPIAPGSSGPTSLSVLSGTGGNPVNFGETINITLHPLPSGITVTGSLTGTSNYTNPLNVPVASFVAPGIYNIGFDYVDVETPSKNGSGSFNVNVVLPPISPGHSQRDESHPTYVSGDANGLWIAAASSTSYVARYAPDSGRWLEVTLSNSVAFVGNQCIQIDQGNQLLYTFQFDGTNSFLSVIDTRVSGSQVHGVTAINGLINTLSVTDQLGGNLHNPVTFVRDPISGSLWTYAPSSDNNTQGGFYNIDPSTGVSVYTATAGTTGFGVFVADVFADGGFLYLCEQNAQGFVYQFQITGSGTGATVNGGGGVGPMVVYDGGLNSGHLQGFDVDPTTGNVVALCNSGEATNFGNTAGYIVIHPATFTVVGQASTSSQGSGITVDASGNVWIVVNGQFEQFVANVLTITKPALPGSFTQTNPYAFRWLAHNNRQPTLFAADADTITDTNGAIYVGDDISSTSPLYIMGHLANAPITTHISPTALVPEVNITYPTNDQPGLWISSGTKVARYSPARIDNTAFFIVPLPNSVVIPPNGIADDTNSQDRLYVLDQANSYVWVIDTTPVVSGGLVGVTGIIGFLDLTSTWPAGSATFAGLAFDSVTTQRLFIADGTSTVYRVDPATAIVTTAAEGNSVTGTAIFSVNGLIGWQGVSTHFDQFDASTFSASDHLFTGSDNSVGISGSNVTFFDANLDGNVYSRGAENNSVNPSTVTVLHGNTFFGDTITLQGVSAADLIAFPIISLWVAFVDSTLGTNQIVYYTIGDNVFQVNAKLLPAPFAFAAPGNYNQGSYGFAWLSVPVALVFVSDNTNNELWSGGINNSPMGVETTFPYFNGGPVSVAASITADSSLSATLFVPPYHVTAHLIGVASVQALLGFQRHFTASLTANSSIFGSFSDDPSSIVADSSLTAQLRVHSAAAAGIVADSSIAADARVHYHLHAASHGDSSIFFQVLHVSASPVANSSFAALHLSGPVRLTSSIVANSLAYAGFPLPVTAAIVADSSIFGDFGDDPTTITANSLITANLTYLVLELTANIVADSSAVGYLPDPLAITDLEAVAVSPTKVRVLFPDVMLNDAHLNAPSSYVVRDAASNVLGVTSATPDNPLAPTVVSLVLSTPLTTSQNYSVTVSLLVQFASGGPLNPNRTGFHWVAEALASPIIISLGDFSGEVEGGLFGDPDGQVFFSPALNLSASNSVIQVEEVDVCTYAYDSYHFPQPIDPVPLYTFGPGRPFGSVLGPGGAVLWAPFPRNMEASFAFGFSPALTNDQFPLADDGEIVTALLRSSWDPSRVALLNDPAWVTYAEQLVVPPTPPLFITADNSSPIPAGGETWLIILKSLKGQSSVVATLSDAIALDASLVADSDLIMQPLATVLSGSSTLTARLSAHLSESCTITAHSQVAASVT